MILSEHHKQFDKTIRSLARSKHLWEVFSDFCELSAISLSNAIRPDPEREERYLRIVKRYEKDEVETLPKLLAITVMALEGASCDFLGEMFMGLELASHWHGQFFTPFNVSKMMADMNLVDIEKILEEKEYVTCVEPCVGAGAMVIALAKSCMEKKTNYQEKVHVTAVDISPVAAHMAYIQLTLLHVPAVVHIGNSLTNEMQEAWHTPAHVMGLWDYKLRNRQECPKPQPVVPEAIPRHQEIIPLFPSDMIIERPEFKEPVCSIKKKQKSEELAQPSFFS